MWSYNYVGTDASDSIQHWKYISRKRVNGKWRYVYPQTKNQSLTKSVGGGIISALPSSDNKLTTGIKSLKDPSSDWSKVLTVPFPGEEYQGFDVAKKYLHQNLWRAILPESVVESTNKNVTQFLNSQEFRDVCAPFDKMYSGVQAVKRWMNTPIAELIKKK